MKVNLHTPIEEVQVQIIPFIDVIFCILTFFILAALQIPRQHATQQGINVDLPKVKPGTDKSVSSLAGRQILPVTVDAIGQTYVEKQPVRREQLAEILKKYLQQNPTGTLVLNASRSATYNDVIEILDLLRQVGGDRVSLGIIPGSSQPTTNPSLPTSPYLPYPGTGASSVAPVYPQQGNSNPNLLPVPNQPLINTPSQPFPGQGVPQVNTGSSPVVPNSKGAAPKQKK
ncbi:MAG: biopolymer transporter ExbD [Rhizonema sp. PD37]|nr:biopolymer transporter ExbD [Rhizonema sp. PD37]